MGWAFTDWDLSLEVMRGDFRCPNTTEESAIANMISTTIFGVLILVQECLIQGTNGCASEVAGDTIQPIQICANAIWRKEGGNCKLLKLLAKVKFFVSVQAKDVGVLWSMGRIVRCHVPLVLNIAARCFSQNEIDAKERPKGDFWLAGV
ncbi:MAG: hypothetical protein AB7V18_02150 [Pyrinomonadaceae bacterium]